MTSKVIAETIFHQMKTIDMNLMMCMGFHKPMVIESGLQFKVNGLKHRGTVRIILNKALDTYEIYLGKQKRVLNKNATDLIGRRVYTTTYPTVKTIKDVYVDDMMPLLEQEVEGR